MNQTICNIHNMKFDPTKYSGCIACTYKKCTHCGKYNIKHDNQYQICFTCNQQGKQPCINCKTNLVKQPFKYCFNCNQSRQKTVPIAPPTLMKTLDSPFVQFTEQGFRYNPVKFYHQ